VIVELIGCAGAGKTTLRRILCEDGSPGREIVAMPDLVRDHSFLRRVEHPTAVNILQEAASLPFFGASWRSNREFAAFARRRLAAGSLSTFEELNGMRGIVRKVGMYRLATRRAQKRLVISDEGTVLSAYNLLVLTGAELDPREVDRFLGLVPLPERIVYVRVPVGTLVERATSRPDPRRQHIGASRAEIERDVRRTVELFELIAASVRLRDRVLVVENDDAHDAARREVAAAIATWLEVSPANAHAHGRVDALGALARV
jgi:AAA domain